MRISFCPGRDNLRAGRAEDVCNGFLQDELPLPDAMEHQNRVGATRAEISLRGGNRYVPGTHSRTSFRAISGK